MMGISVVATWPPYTTDGRRSHGQDRAPGGGGRGGDTITLVSQIEGGANKRGGGVPVHDF